MLTFDPEALHRAVLNVVTNATEAVYETGASVSEASFASVMATGTHVIRTTAEMSAEGGSAVTPVRKLVMTSIGFVVAEMPTRVGGRSQSASSRSSDSARCAPRLLPASA